jgi:glycosyltransferase involved in cell wall biosynthesis/2-polyprenyl-3-methyl-5-hydroxy-6-metoxy-1,4-benzoquinol methylase
MHLFSIANVLTDLGHCCAVCVPGRPETVLDHGQPRFQVLDYDHAVRYGVSFPNRQIPDLVHAWTPRELVRKMTSSLVQRYRIPYFVHLEDNQIRVLLDELKGRSLEDLERLPTRALDFLVPNHRVHPHRYRRLLAGAAGVTASIDPLLEFKPVDVPGKVFFPGHDPEFAKIDSRDEELRTDLGILPNELLVVYAGDADNSNFQEVRSLVLAIALVNRRGFRVKLVKTGWNHYVLPELSDPEIAQNVIDRGFVSRREEPRLLAAADVLVQPGQPNEINDFRFPAKLPEFLASARPVVLPRSNLGLLLKDGEEGVLLEHGHSADIANALERLAKNPEMRARIGRGGRAFALQNLDWVKNVATITRFYDCCLAEKRRAKQPGWVEQSADPKLVAFYLPQFHPIPENDVWWGKGFTEWANTVAARPNFEGHAQPRLASDLGFYNLRLPETLDAQATLARRFGVYGFCFYYYWFNGRRLPERPLNELLERRKPDFPFCICWVNDNWTRRLDDQEDEILIKQEYGEDFSVKFIRDVIPILRDDRYIRVRGEPILMVYRVTLLPDPRATAEVWRSECRQAGIPSLHLVAVQSFGIDDPRPFGFDAAVEFPSRTGRFDPGTFPGVDPKFEGGLEDYRKVVTDHLAKPLPEYLWYRTVVPPWDNTACNDRAHILSYSSPAGYQAWLRRVTAQAIALAEKQEPLVFINSWNEWAEGAILEPDGKRFLEATRAGLSEGLADYMRADGIRIEEAAASKLLLRDDELTSRSESLQKQDRRSYKTSTWFDDEKLAETAARYREYFETVPLSYATARDFSDSFDYLRPIATANGDLKDSQRPWALKAILSVVPPGSRVLEIGAGEPFIADILDRLDYEVWVVDPYDGTGNGPLEYERFRKECPRVNFVRGLFGEQVLPAPPGGFDCIYSISVLEHIPDKALEGVFAGMKKYLQPNGWSIHAVDHVHRGSGAEKHYKNLKSMVLWSGFEETELTQLIERMAADNETYYLSAESHNRWRGVRSYDKFPMRVCVSVQIISRAAHLLVPTSTSI